jgi:hypothetical protein
MITTFLDSAELRQLAVRLFDLETRANGHEPLRVAARLFRLLHGV